MSSFEQRLSVSDETRNQVCQEEFIGVNIHCDGYNKRCVVVKTKESGKSNYSFSLDQIAAYDFLESVGVPVIVMTKDKRRHSWKSIRSRMDSTTQTFQVVSL